MRKLFSLIAYCATALLVWAPAQAADTGPFGFTEDQYSTWGIVDAPYPNEGNTIDHGYFPVGNRLVFGHLSADNDFNTLRGLTGPGNLNSADSGDPADVESSSWPDLHMALSIVPGEQVEWETQSIRQVRGAAMVMTSQRSSAGTLSALTYALPKKPVLICEFALELDVAEAPAITLQIDGAEIDINELVLYQGGNELTIQPSKASIKGGVLSVQLEQDAAGIWRGAIALLLTRERPRPAVELFTDSLAAHRQQTYGHWQNSPIQGPQGNDMLAPPRLAYDEVVELKLLVALFPNTFTHQMGQAEIENFHHEMAEWVAWYDEVADSRVKLSLDFIQVNTLLNENMSGSMGDDVYWMGHGDVEQMLIERGVKLNHYDNVCAFWAWDRDYEAWEGAGKAKQAYGGAAQGPASDMEFLGKAKRTGYFGSAVLASHPDRISKNAIHEFLHNLDAMLELCGVPELSHPDQMSRNMETLLAEVPGCFEHLGLSDDDLRGMVAAELRNEISYPWPAQLVYYQQAIKRLANSEYGGLLQHFGAKQKRRPRTRLYENYILPEGVPAYQVADSEGNGLTRVQLDDYDFVNKDDLIWQSEVWAGYLEGETESQSVQRYFEAEIDYPSVVEFILGDVSAINPGLLDLGTDSGVPGAEMWLELDGHRLNFLNLGGYEYTADLPMDIGGNVSATFYAKKDGYVITPRPVKFEVKPPWELTFEIVEEKWNSPDSYVQADGYWLFKVDPPDDPFRYTLHIEVTERGNAIWNMLERDIEEFWGTSINTYMRMVDGELRIPYSNRSNHPYLATLDVTVQQEYHPYPPEPENNRADYSFSYHFPAQKHWTSLLYDIAEERGEPLGKILPDYIPRCSPITPKIDGELGEWKTQPSIILSPDNGNIFSGEVESKADAAVVLWLGYDDDYLYVAGGVRDDMTPGNGSWDSDRINLCFDALTDTTRDTYPDGAVRHNAWAKDDFWVFLNPMLPEGPKSMRLGGERPGGDKNGYYGPLADAQMVVVPEEGGSYRFEWAIPLEALPYLSPEPGTFCGFTMFYSDYDEALSEMMYLTDWGGENGIDWRFWDCGLLYFE